MADAGSPLLAVLRFAGFAGLAVLGPGLALQRLLVRRWDPALVVPSGLLFASLAYWLSLLAHTPWLFVALVAAANLPLLRGGTGRECVSGPRLRGALVPVALIVALLAATQYRVNRVAPDGTFHLDLGEHIDTAVHVGLTWELASGYPPQVPGLAGIEIHYHVGSHLQRAAAARWAGIHPYDSLARFDVTLWAIGLVLVLRAVAHELGLGARAVALAGFLPLVADLSFVPGLWTGSSYWAFKLGTSLVEAVFFANSIAPALALALGALACLARAERGDDPRWLGLGAVLAAGVPLFKVFTGAQLLLALGTAWILRPSRRSPLVAGVPLGLVLIIMAVTQHLATGSDGVRTTVEAFAPANPARIAFSLDPVSGGALAASGLAWVVLSLGVRVLGVAPAVAALRGTGAAATLAAFALWGWPIALFVSVKADPSYDESFYFVQGSGLALLLFAAPVVAGIGASATRRAVLARAGMAALAVSCLIPTVEFVARKASQEPGVVPAPAVRAMAALRAASCPGEVVVARPGVPYQVPLPVVLAGRRVAFANYIPYWRQFTTPELVARREQQVRSFLRARTPDAVLAAARLLEARYLYLRGRGRPQLVAAGSLGPLFEERGEHVYRIAPAEPRPACELR